ncbi:MAG TPA: ABC transporter ATP-binding protein [Ruminiclostridium sp.]|jgi:branched-chain amino acid transport system ATP-binding protein|nr:ABC transporter ATP-binding protein [Ruminiclostridium sp.]
MISIQNLHAYYGPIEVLKGIDVEVPQGEITCLIGNNGAGKSTLLKAISGMIRRSGSIFTSDQTNIINKRPTEIARMGIVHVPEGRHVFPGLTVEENLAAGAINWHGFFGRQSYQNELEEVYELFPRLKERRKQLSWSLSGGEQQMLAMGRGIMGRPNMLLLDEPSMGLAPVVVTELFEKIVEINKQMKIPILLVEQNARLAMRICQNTYVMDQGQIVTSGKSVDLRDDPKIVQAYLGKLAMRKITALDI